MPLNLTADQRIERAVIVGDDGCWHWQRYINKDGYGTIRLNKVRWLAHRLTYTIFVGPIPDGTEIDHLCGNRDCVNPDHLEAVTRTENLNRSNHPNHVTARTGVCQRGHDMEGRRRCRLCINERARARRCNAAIAIHTAKEPLQIRKADLA